MSASPRTARRSRRARCESPSSWSRARNTASAFRMRFLYGSPQPRTVIPGLVPGIHVYVLVDGRVKPGHDEYKVLLQLADMAGPAIEDRQDLAGLVRHQRDVDRVDADVAEALQP